MFSAPAVLFAFGVTDIEQWALKIALQLPASFRDLFGLAAVNIILLVLAGWQIGRAIGLLRRLAARPFYRRIVVWTSFAIGVFLLLVSIVVWAMPGGELSVQAARILIPYESLSVFCVGVIGLVWMLRDRLRHKPAQ